MSFNLRRAKERSRPIDYLRQIVPDLRYSDLDTDDDAELSVLASLLQKADLKKEAVHGRGDNWTEVGPGFNPYRTSPLVNPSPTGWGNHGNRFRNPGLPSSGDQHINDSKDKKKNQRGNGNDFDPTIKNRMINERLKKIHEEENGQKYLVRIDLGEDIGTRELASELFGQDGKFDQHSVYVEVEDFNKAVHEESRQKARGYSARIETKRHEKED